jgi:hypothetical protein
VSNICKKASRQLNVLKRIGTHLTKLGKLTISVPEMRASLSWPEKKFLGQ